MSSNQAQAPKLREQDVPNGDTQDPETEKRTLASNDYDQKQKILVCFLYAATSISISMCYKVKCHSTPYPHKKIVLTFLLVAQTVLSTFHFEAEFLLLVCQQVLGILFCWFAQKYLNDYKMVRVPKFDFETFKK